MVESEAKLFAKMLSAKSAAEVKEFLEQADCVVEGQVSTNLVRTLFSKYVLVGRTGEKVWDTSPDHMKGVVTEFVLFILLKLKKLSYTRFKAIPAAGQGQGLKRALSSRAKAAAEGFGTAGELLTGVAT